MKEEQPLVSVVTPAHNAEPFLAETIQSVLDQTYRNFEIIVVDDASTDRTAEIAEGFGPPVRVLRNERNLERSASRNRAVAEARGELIALLDADDLWLPEKLEKQVAAMNRDPDAALVYGKAEAFVMEEGERRIIWQYGSELPAHRADLALIEGNRIPPLTALFRREPFRAVGGFCEEPWIQCSGEDYDLWLRMGRRYRFRFIPEVLGLYRRHKEQTTYRNAAGSAQAAVVALRHMLRQEPPDEPAERSYARACVQIRAAIEQEHRALRAEAERYHDSYDAIMAKAPVRAYRRLKRWLRGRESSSGAERSE